MTATISCLGKLPLHGDFIRLNHAQCPEIVEIDRWLLQGMERAYAARGRAFDADLRSFPALRILYVSASTGRLWNGVVTPSADQVGRVYPFVAGWAMAQPAPGPSFDRLPLVGDTSVVALQQLIGRDSTRVDSTGVASSGVDSTSRNLAGFLADLGGQGFVGDDNLAEQALRQFLFGTSIEALWSEWPGFQANERRQQGLHELWHLGQPPFPPRYLTTIPYRGRAVEVAFWLSLLRQWLPVRRNPVLVAWPAASGERGAVRVIFDVLDPRYFEAVFWPGTLGSGLLDIGRQTVNHHAEPGAPRFAASLPTRGLLQDLILAAARVGG